MKFIGFAGILALCLSFSTIGQAQSSDTDAADNDAANDEMIEEVTVTGSRVARDGSSAPTPVTAISSDDLAVSAPSNIPDALNKLPQFTGSTSEMKGGTFNAGSTPLGNYMNLRGLTSGRVLILLNGQRMTPTAYNSNAVDINVLPQMLVQRVDIVTGGVSAVYGSDAVSGAINFILDDQFTGIKMDANYGISQESDNQTYKAGVAGGFELGDRAHLLVSAEFYNNDGIPHLYDRDWAVGENQRSRQGAGLAGNPFRIGPPGGFPASEGGVFNSGPFANMAVQPDGTVVPFNAFVNGGAFGTAENGGTSIVGELQTTRLFGKLQFDFSDTTSGHITGFYSNADTNFNSVATNSVSGGPTGARATLIYSGDPDSSDPWLLPNAYLRPDLNAQWQAAIAADPSVPTFSHVRRMFNDFGLVTNETTNEYANFIAGLNGQFSDNWHWDATASWGKAKQGSNFNEFEVLKFQAAVDAIRDPATGNIVCGVTVRNPGLLDDCLPLNVLGVGNFDPAARDWVRSDSTFDITNEMQYVNFNVNGDLFQMPAGPLSAAFGAEYRKQTLKVVSNSAPRWVDDTGQLDQAAYDAAHEGIRGLTANPQQAILPFNSINRANADGKQTVKEIYGELAIPVIDNLDLSLAARYTDYETSGSVTTWKAGINWQATSGLRFRANRSRDIAAASLWNLFGGASPTFGQFNDPHVTEGDPVAVPIYYTVGNPDLRPEEADTTTIGLVFQPESVPGLTMTIDYYDIEVKDTVAPANPTNMAIECENSGGTAKVCENFIRPLPFDDHTQANQVQVIYTPPQNLARLETAGVDLNATYAFDFAGGDLQLRAFVGYIDKYQAQDTPESIVVEYVGHANPIGGVNEGFGVQKWKGMLSETYTRDRFSGTLSQRFTGSYTAGNALQIWDPQLKQPNVTYWDLNLSYRLGSDENYQVYFNVQNMLDTDPEIAYVLAPYLTVPVDKQTYDVVGRYFTLGFRAQF